MKLTEQQHDALCEALNIGTGFAADTISRLVKAPVSLNIPAVNFSTIDNLETYLCHNYSDWNSYVSLRFDNALSGECFLIFTNPMKDKWLQTLDGPEFAFISESDILLELGNIIINSCIGAIANFLEEEISFHLPHYVNRSNCGGQDFADHSNALLLYSNIGFEDCSCQTSLIIALDDQSIEKFSRKIKELKQSENAG